MVLSGSMRVRAAPQLAFRRDGTLDVDATLASLPACVQAGVTDVDFPLLFVAPGETAFDDLLATLGKLPRALADYT